METNRGDGAGGSGGTGGAGGSEPDIGAPAEGQGGGSERHFPASEVRRPAPAVPAAAVPPEVVVVQPEATVGPGLSRSDPGDLGDGPAAAPRPDFGSGGSGRRPFGSGSFGSGAAGSWFGPRTVGGVQLWGCSPGCLIVSLVGSVILTLLLNGMLGLFF